MFNKIILVGNLTRDIELRYAQSGTAIANTAIATSRKFTQNGEKKEEVCFVDITFFGRSGEVANQYLRKGSKILVEGRLNFEQWVDKTSGQKRSKHSVIAETMQMLDSKGDNQGGGYNAPAQGETPSYQQPAQQQQQSYNAPQQQQQSYQAPAQQQQQPQQGYNNQANAQSRQMPSPDSVPVIDIDEDEIPF